MLLTLSNTGKNNLYNMKKPVIFSENNSNKSKKCRHMYVNNELYKYAIFGKIIAYFFLKTYCIK